MHMPSGHELLWAVIGIVAYMVFMHLKAKKSSS